MIHVMARCDGGWGCGGAVKVGFDSLTETFGDLVAGLRGLGWRVETDVNSRLARCLCPEHAREVDADQPVNP